MTISVAALAAIEQDRAAGSKALRQLRLKNGEVVTASLKLEAVKSPADEQESTYSVQIRFSTGGQTLSRPVGRAAGKTRFAALKRAWAIVRAGHALEKDGWKWVVPVAEMGTTPDNKR
jgi:hypothetical protein